MGKTDTASRGTSDAGRSGTSGATRTGRQAGRGQTGAPTDTPLRVIGYVRVSTEEQGRDGHGLRAQWDALDRWCGGNGYELVTVIPDVMSSRRLDRLHGRAAAIAAVEAGLADVVAVRALDRATRSVLDGATLLDRAGRRGWRLMDLEGVDSANEDQQALNHMRLTFAQEERRKISERTKDGLARARNNGTRTGRPIGAPRSVTPEATREILRLYGKGLSYKKIAAALDEAGVPTPRGGAGWSHSCVRTVILRESEVPS